MDPFKDGKTAVRGGFGIFEILPIVSAVGGDFPSELPFQAQSSVSLHGSTARKYVPDGSLSLIPFNPNNIDYSNFRVSYVQPNPANSYAMNWNLNIQRDLGWNSSIMVGYIGSHSVHSTFDTGDANGVQGTLTSAGYLWPFPVGSGTKLNPNVGQLSSTFWNGSSRYNGLQVQFTKRLSHEVQAQGAYTWSRCIDYGSGGNVTATSSLIPSRVSRTTSLRFVLAIAIWIYANPSYSTMFGFFPARLLEELLSSTRWVVGKWGGFLRRTQVRLSLYSFPETHSGREMQLLSICLTD